MTFPQSLGCVLIFPLCAILTHSVLFLCYPSVSLLTHFLSFSLCLIFLSLVTWVALT